MRRWIWVVALVLGASCKGNTVDEQDTGDSGGAATDADGDGYPSGLDCDDLDASVNPGATETCNGIDDDCNGTVDDAPVDAGTWYADADGDGWGDDAATATACEAPTGYVAAGGDCDDTDDAYHPAAPESDCTDPNDYNCDGSTGFADADGDGYAACAECDDTDAAVNPGATEICNGVDDDCDGTVDDSAADAGTWYADADGDGWGDDGAPTTACEAPTGYVAVGGDCDDTDAAYHPGAPESDCADPNDYNCDGSSGQVDADGDGYAACAECDDADAAVNPGATEVCNGVDDNCDGTVDTDAADSGTWYADADGDGYGDAATSTVSCAAPTGYVADATDCDDADAAVNPAALEICNGVDDDCDTLQDEADPDVADVATWYLDADGDGWGGSTSVVACTGPSGAVTTGGDCDDADGDVYPGATEVCNGVDDDCDGAADVGAIDASTWYADADDDGFGNASSWAEACDAPTGTVADDTDCDDSNPDVNSDATEECNGYDDDCDGLVDGDDPDATGTATWFADDDADGYGDASDSTAACTAPSGYVLDDTDCDDADADVNPGADEVCNGSDDDCDGAVDDADADVTDAVTVYDDDDGDGWGDDGTATITCTPPSDTVETPGDCDDGDFAVNPDATEVCNGEDDDCDGSVDEAAADGTIWYADVDGDGYGDASATATACSAPTGYVSDSTDCDDTDATAHPGGTEVCDGADNDCDGLVDGDDPDATGTTDWYADGDGDGYGDASTAVSACSAPTGYVADDTDCDDSDAAVNPGADELCNYDDDDCDGLIDDDDPDGVADGSTWYADDDGDGYGDATDSVEACAQPSGYVSDSTDCDDRFNFVYPGATELCDGLDDDCDGSIDEGLSTRTYYADADGDGWGDASSSITACVPPSGYVWNDDDCDDTDADISPSDWEVCSDGVDNDCDGSSDERPCI